jgi:hypothetical protein
MASSSDIRAGAAYIELTLRDLASKGLDEAAERLQHFGDSMAWTGAKIAALGASITAPLVAMAHTAVDAMAAMGDQMGGEDAKAARGYLAALRMLTTQLGLFRNAVAGAVLPALTEQAVILGRLAAGAVAWARANRELIATIFGVGFAIVTAGAAIAFLGFVIARVGSVLAIMSTAVTIAASAVSALGTVLAAMLTPIGAVIAGVLALGAYLLYASGLGEAALAWLGEKFVELKDEAIASWGAIADALATGDFALAGKIVWLTLKQEWTKGVNWMNGIWLGAKKTFLDVWMAGFFQMQRYWTDALAYMETNFPDTVKTMRQTWATFNNYMTHAWNTSIGFIRKAWVNLKALFDEDIDVNAEVHRINEEQNAANAQADAKLEEDKRFAEERSKMRPEEIERERRRKQADIDNRQAADADARQQQFDADMAALDDELAAARAELNAARNKAKDQRQAADKQRPQLEGIGGGLGMEMQRLEGRGTFNAMAVRGLGANSLAERAARAGEQTAENTRRLLEAWNRGVLPAFN